MSSAIAKNPLSGAYRATTVLSETVKCNSQALAMALSGLTRTPDQEGGGSPIVDQQLETAVMLMKQFVDDANPNCAADYVAGWLRMVVLQHPGHFRDFPFAPDVVDSVMQAWLDLLTPEIDRAARARLSQQLNRISEQLSKAAEKSLRVLFIGDCLVWDIATHLQIHTQAEGYDLEPVLVAKRLGVDLRNALHQMRSDAYDLIFYSPFSFGFSDAYAAFIAPRNALRPAGTARAALHEAARDVQKTLDVLARHFECPVYVHNVSSILQVERGWRGIVANTVTRPRRRWAGRFLNRELIAFIDELTAATGRPILRIDETEALSRHSERELGQVLFNAGELHPTALAHELAGGAYSRACWVTRNLCERKLVVCDLDNTLWSGEIGDGTVIQHKDRQEALQHLKAKGVVLAVSSKNDPANIRWDESVLSPEDFVAAEINWGRKAANIRKMAQSLNLTPNSFVFIDDRPDERATVAEELPGVLALDPNEPATWDLIREWTETLGSAALKDRTKLYQERRARQGHLDSSHVGEEDPSEVYRKLELRLKLRNPTKKDMDRVVELINRTNQFNTTTARTSIAEMTRSDVTRHVLVAQAGDRFGDMGIVGVLVITDEARPEISHFVLSCRVFGFGIENAIVQSILAQFGDRCLRARLVATPVNGPCREVFADNGFLFDGEVWVSQGGRPDTVPDWLTIEDRFCKSPAKQGDV